MEPFEYSFNTDDIENELSNFIASVIKGVDEQIIFDMLRRDDHIDVEIPRMEVGNYIVNPFTARVPREKIEEIIFTV